MFRHIFVSYFANEQPNIEFLLIIIKSQLHSHEYIARAMSFSFLAQKTTTETDMESLREQVRKRIEFCSRSVARSSAHLQRNKLIFLEFTMSHKKKSQTKHVLP